MQYTGDPRYLREVLALTRGNVTGFLTRAKFPELEKSYLAEMQGGHFPTPDFNYSPAALREQGDKLPALRYLLATILEHIQLVPESDPLYPVDHALYLLLINRFSELENIFMLAKTIMGNNDRASLSHIITIHGQPDEALYALAARQQDPFRRANLEYQHQKKRHALIYTDHQITGALQRVLAAYGFKGWTITTAPSAQRVRLNFEHGTITIPQGLILTEPELQKLIGEHIETRIRGQQNTRSLLYRLLGNNSGLAPLVPWLAQSYDQRACLGSARVSRVSIAANATGNGQNELPTPWLLLAMQHYSAHGFSQTAEWLYGQLRESGGYQPESAHSLTWHYLSMLSRGQTDPSHTGFAHTEDDTGFTGYYQLQLMPAPLRQFTLNFNTLNFSEAESLYHAVTSLPDDQLVASFVSPRNRNLHLATSDLPLAC